MLVCICVSFGIILLRNEVLNVSKCFGRWRLHLLSAKILVLNQVQEMIQTKTQWKDKKEEPFKNTTLDRIWGLNLEISLRHQSIFRDFLA